jgi:hypothetical protein
MLSRRSIGTIACLLVSMTLCRLSFGQDVHPFVGSWTLNLDKSKFEGSQPMKSETWQVTAEKDGLLRMVIDWVDFEGTSGHVDYLTACDGKVRPIHGSRDFDAVRYDQLSPRKFKSVLLKDGKVVERESYLVSSDGNTWWDTDSGYDEHGKPWTFYLVFDRRR